MFPVKSFVSVVTKVHRNMSSAADLVKFINASPSPFHAVSEAESRLVNAGFKKLSEQEMSWDVAPEGKYYITRNQSALIAFAVGGKYVPGNGFSIAAGHTDSPCLRVKPISELHKAGYLSLGVETYGGGIWHSWFDRDLSVAGRVIIATSPDNFESRLVRINRPICRVPSLAIHLDRTVNESFKVNTESHLPPILGTLIKGQLDSEVPSMIRSNGVTNVESASNRHHAGFIITLAKELNVDPKQIIDFELSLYDTQGATIGGLYDEFVFAPRLDNLCMTHSVITGLINSLSDKTTLPLKTDPNIRIAACFDHEEVGSDSVPGASSTFLEDTITRLCPDAAVRAAAIRRSILVSADMAHAIHPNYAAMHEENHRPQLHRGIVIKCNTNQRYATTSVTATLFRKIAADNNIPLQNFVIRQDLGCGSTIGPIVSTRLGLRTVDIGVPQLSMHSCREMCGTDDVDASVKYFTHFYGSFPVVEASLTGSD